MQFNSMLLNQVNIAGPGHAHAQRSQGLVASLQAAVICLVVFGGAQFTSRPPLPLSTYIMNDVSLFVLHQFADVI